ncbi:unnamed protein product [Coregonus sp. 'balchen']|nr:unnamed protein product [Coregonus sp. 'balchen']
MWLLTLVAWFVIWAGGTYWYLFGNPSPFSLDSVRPPEPREFDQRKRDKVNKQGTGQLEFVKLDQHFDTTQIGEEKHEYSICKTEMEAHLKKQFPDDSGIANFLVLELQTCVVINALLLHHDKRDTTLKEEISYHIIPVIQKSGGNILVRPPITQILVNKDGAAYGENPGVKVRKGQEEVEVHAPVIISNCGLFTTFQKLLPPQIQTKPDVYSLVVLCRMEGFFAMSKEDEPDNIPMMFITFPSAKDPIAKMRHPGRILYH